MKKKENVKENTVEYRSLWHNCANLMALKTRSNARLENRRGIPGGK